MEYIHSGYLIFFMLIGVQSDSHVSSSNNVLSWAPEHIALAPGPAILVSPSKSEEKSCGDISPQECLQKLQTFLALKSLPFTSEEKELNKLCIRTVDGYNCSAIKSTTPNCLSSPDKDLFPVFVEMAQYLMYMFCTDDFAYLREALLKHSECILKQKEALDCCAEGSKLTNFPVMYVLEQSSKSIKERQLAACCPVANYLKCAIPIVEKNCGKDAANLTTRYVRRSSGEPLEALCQKMPDYPELSSDICEDPPATCSGSSIRMLMELIAAMCIVYIARIKFM